MNYKLLKKLCLTHAVTGDTKEIINTLKEELESQSIKYTEESNGTIAFGNTRNPKKLFACHIDEVGFQVTKIEQDGKIRILPVGWVFANRLDHAIVYIKTNKPQNEKIRGLIIHQEILKQENISDFSSLFVDIGANSYDEAIEMGIREGSCGSFQKEFWDTPNTIIASSVDNKISQFIILEILKTTPSLLDHNMVAFTTDEEMQDHSANGICHKYSPEYAFVLDYCPIHQKQDKNDMIGKTGNGPLVSYRGGNWIIHHSLREIFDSQIKTKFQKIFISNNTLPSLEPTNFEDNGTTKAVNIMIQALGYHGSAYSIRKTDIQNFHNLVKELMDE